MSSRKSAPASRYAVFFKSLFFSLGIVDPL
jgi:hypothetical protein